MALPGDYLSRAIENSNRLRQSAAATGYQAGMQKYGVDTQKAIADQNLQLQRDIFNLRKMQEEYDFNREKRKHKIEEDTILQAVINESLEDEQQKLMEDTKGWFSDKEYDQYSKFWADKHGTGAFPLGNLTELRRNLWGLITGQGWDSAYDPEIYKDLTYQGKPAYAELRDKWKYINPSDLEGIDIKLLRELSPYLEQVNRKKYSDKKLLDLATRGGQ